MRPQVRLTLPIPRPSRAYRPVDGSSGTRLRIAFLTSRDPKDRRSWSGTFFYMAAALQRHCGDVALLGPALFPPALLGIPFNRASRALLGKGYDYEHNRLMSAAYGYTFGRKLKSEQFDVIFAPTASTEIAHLKTRIPIVYSSDTTFALMHDYYPNQARLFGFSAREANEIERLAVTKAEMLIYPSRWAARSAIEAYGADERRVHIVPMGANLDEAPPIATLAKATSGVCMLLFLARDWDRKGGPIAFDAFVKLRKLGIDAELIVCGCAPPARYQHTKLTVIPFLDKNDARQRVQLENLLAASHFLLVPTRGDCSPIVFCEANAFGVPVVTTDTGGVSGIVRNGINGYMLPIEANGDEYAQVIYHVFQNERGYLELVRGSRTAFEESLNWDTWGLRVAGLIRQQFEPEATAATNHRTSSG